MTTRIGHLTSTPRAGRSTYGAHHSERFEGRSEAQLAKRVGITQFGVNHMTLAPGAYASLRHWHEQEDEFVYVLFGAPTLVDGAGEHLLAPGDYVGFPGNDGDAHTFVNRSDEPAGILSVGTRHRGREVVHYPDDFPQPNTVDRDQNGDRL